MKIIIEQIDEWWRWRAQDDRLIDSVPCLKRYRTKNSAKRGAVRFIRSLWCQQNYAFIEAESVVDAKP